LVPQAVVVLSRNSASLAAGAPGDYSAKRTNVKEFRRDREKRRLLVLFAQIPVFERVVLRRN
jgi:hypothetical protein